MTQDGNYDLKNKKLTNVGEGTFSSDTITKHQLDTAMINVHNNDANSDFKDTYNVINSKYRTKAQLDSAEQSLISYKEAQQNFLSLNSTTYKIDTFHDMNKHTIQHLPLPVIITSSCKQAVC